MVADRAARSPAGFQPPPHNLVVEQKLLGVLMVNNDALAVVHDRLRPEHFYEPGHAAIYSQTSGRIIDGRLADVDALSAGMDEAGKDAMFRLAQLSVGVPVDEVRQCADELIALWQRRKQIELAETLRNVSYDLGVPDVEWRARLIQDLTAVDADSPQRRIKPCDIPALDWARVANEETPKERWLIDQWIPVGTSGILTGPGSSGKSFLELIRVICLASGTRFLGPNGYDVEPTPCIAYFSEDSEARIWARVRLICAGLQLDPARLIGRLDVVSTVGNHCHLITAEPNAHTTVPTDWFHRVRERTIAISARFIAFDHVGRYLAINRNDPNQVFSAFGHLDHLATAIDGSVELLAHPSKTDLRNKQKQGNGPIVGYVGGAAAMIDAPRYVQILDSSKDTGGSKYRFLISHKANYCKAFGRKLEENKYGIVEATDDIDPDDPACVNSISARGRKSNADRTLLALEDMFFEKHQVIHIDDLIDECIRRGIIVEALRETTAWRGRRRTIRDHLERFPARVQEAENGRLQDQAMTSSCACVNSFSHAMEGIPHVPGACACVNRAPP